MNKPDTTRFDVVRGALSEQTAEELSRFWQRASTGGESRPPLEDIVCVLRADREISGASWVFPAELELIARRRFWVYRTLLLAEAAEHAHALISLTFKVLDAEPRSAGFPVGMCVLLGPDERLSDPQAEWPEPRTIHAGYLGDGRQVRIAYFSDEVSSMARETPAHGWVPQPGYRIDPFAEENAAEIVSLWTGEAGLSLEEAERRLSEVLFVGVSPNGHVGGILTAYLRRNDQLRADFWYFRAFVAASHRKSDIAVSLVVRAREHLEQRFVSGEDQRAIGIIFEIENEELKRYFPKGLWYESDVFLIGENPRGDHVRVRYFNGALAPEPG